MQYIIIAGWCVFLIFSGGYYFKVMIPTMQYYTINNPYTMDSVWNAEENDWHNDMLLNTIFSEKKVYINPESWYINYVQAFAKNVVLDNAMDTYVPQNASVCASGFFTPHLSKHLEMYDQNHLTEDKYTDYLVVDERNQNEAAKFTNIVNSGKYELIHREDNLISIYHLKENK